MDARRIDLPSSPIGGQDWELEELRANLRNWDIRDIVTLLGESDVLEVIGVERCWEFIETVSLGPASAERAFVRKHVRFLAASLECVE